MTRLEEIFNLANSRYFRGRLKNVKIKWKRGGWKKKTVVGTTTSPDGEKFLIQISDQIRIYNSLVITTVLHEMIHVQQWNKVSFEASHGNKFNARMKQLANLGAFRGLW